MRFGAFMSPLHTLLGQSPVTALARDVAKVQGLDELGYEEMWIGEHHSGGTEIISSPEIFIAHVAERTRHIKLGAGVLSLPYHNPLWVADRAILLDYLTRGRFMLGLGPGALPTDAAMIGMDSVEQRGALEEDVDVLMQLLLTDEPVTKKTARYELVDARCQLNPYTRPCFDVGVAAIASPTGPRIAGKHGLSLLSVGATMVGDLDLLAMHWDVAEQKAAEHGTTMNRDGWRLVGLMYLAETKEQAIKDCEYGLDSFFEYEQKVAGVPQFEPQGETLRQRIDWVNDSGIGVIGTPAEAVELIQTLERQSNGGFGCYLMLDHEWARAGDIKRHYELFASEVAPHFQNRLGGITTSYESAKARRSELAARQGLALQQAIERHTAEQATRA